MTLLSNAESHKLGSESDPIRQRLFACQTMEELLQRTKISGTDSPFQLIADAAKLANEGNKGAARSRLHSILGLPKLETRVELWVWSALRELGEQPDAQTAFEILGVVVEVPMQGAYDTLAAYQDGTARYLNFSGKAIFWDAPDVTIKGLCTALLTSGVLAGSRAKPRIGASLPNSGVQATLLTRSGNYVVSNPPQPIAKAAATLMMELIGRTKQAQS